RRTILEPIVEGLSRLGNPFHGVLYAGLMIVRDELKVLEFNARLGDPEAQVVLPLVKTDLVEILTAVVEHRLDRLMIDCHERAADPFRGHALPFRNGRTRADQTVTPRAMV